ncbi:MgtC/SapB family protein [Phenylobacterium sp.]|uniref:MgtC/SapB family protein n=1 Tax=Phenylobacterium sp. TaxID=1871053 RepID=UPI0035B023A4
MFHDWMTTYGLPILGAVVAGALIGLEREYRGHAAGFRTHILVSLGAALLMLAATHQEQWLGHFAPETMRIDPTRMAHGILTGVGFLCAGVIFRQGLSIHGLTTAASLWVTAALGVVFGVGLYGLAVSGVAAALVILVLLRIGAAFLPQQIHIELVVRYRRAEAMDEEEVRALVGGLHLHPEAMGFRLLEGGQEVELCTTLRGPARGATQMLARKLADDPRVLSFDVAPRNI